MLSPENFSRLQEIHDELRDLLEEAKNIVRRGEDENEYERAKATWIGNIDTALDKDGDFLTGPTRTMQDTIDHLEPDEEDGEYEEDEEDEE
jgi:hypothetical protein